MKLNLGKLYVVKNSPVYYAMWENKAVNYVGRLPSDTVLFYMGRIRFKDQPSKETYMKFLYLKKIIYVDYSWKPDMAVYG